MVVVNRQFQLSIGNIKRKLDPHLTPSVSRPMFEPG
jgi:hypothetical protein